MVWVLLVLALLVFGFSRLKVSWIVSGPGFVKSGGEIKRDASRIATWEGLDKAIAALVAGAPYDLLSICTDSQDSRGIAISLEGDDKIELTTHFLVSDESGEEETFRGFMVRLGYELSDVNTVNRGLPFESTDLMYVLPRDSIKVTELVRNLFTEVYGSSLQEPIYLRAGMLDSFTSSLENDYLEGII